MYVTFNCSYSYKQKIPMLTIITMFFSSYNFRMPTMKNAGRCLYSIEGFICYQVSSIKMMLCAGLPGGAGGALGAGGLGGGAGPSSGLGIGGGGPGRGVGVTTGGGPGAGLGTGGIPGSGVGTGGGPGGFGPGSAGGLIKETSQFLQNMITI